MEQLILEAKVTQRKAYAFGTFNNYYVQWVKYLRFCVYFSLQAFPATTSILVWYVQYVSRSLRAHGSILASVAGAKKLHEFLGFSTDGFDGFFLKITLLGLHRSSTHVVKRAKPVTPSMLRRIHAVTNHQDPVEAVFWGCNLLAFLLLFRKSNLVPDTVNGFDGSKQLKHSDCLITDNKVIIGIRWAKNHQFRKELLTFPLAKLPSSVLCPAKAINNIRKLIPGNPNDHLFQLPNKQGSLTYSRFQSIFREKLIKIGLSKEESKRYSSHSYRRGGTTFNFLCGVPVEIIKLMGNWKSDVFLTYIEFPLETRTAACEIGENENFSIGAIDAVLIYLYH